MPDGKGKGNGFVRDTQDPEETDYVDLEICYTPSAGPPATAQTHVILRRCVDAAVASDEHAGNVHGALNGRAAGAEPPSEARPSLPSPVRGHACRDDVEIVSMDHELGHDSDQKEAERGGPDSEQRQHKHSNTPALEAPLLEASN